MPELRSPALLAILAACLLALSGAVAVRAAAASAAEEGAPLAIPMHRAVYHGSVRRMAARATVELEQLGDDMFVYRTRVEPRGVLGFIRREVSENSLVTIDSAGRILPLSYRKRDDFGGRHSDMRFDHIAGTVQIEYRGEEITADWEPGIYDLLSLRLVIANDFARGTLRDVYHVIDDRGRVEEADVVVAGPEVLSTPLGNLETVRLDYHNRKRDRTLSLWIAPGMNSALVKLEQTDGGQSRGSLVIVEYEPLSGAG